MFTRCRAKVDEVVARAHDGLLMFYDNHGVAFVSQVMHDLDELVDVALV